MKPDDITTEDGILNMLVGLLPEHKMVALLIFDEKTREYSLTHNCGVDRLRGVLRNIDGKPGAQ